MKLSLFITVFLFISITLIAQDVTTHIVKPAGEYKQIDLSEELAIIKRITDPNNSKKDQLIDSIQRSVNNFTPSLLYIMSAVIFQEGRQESGMYWFYLAQLRARYDANRSADKTASAARYNAEIGPPINQYALSHIDTLENIMKRVVDFVKDNNENYDPRWISMEGMAVFTTAFGGKGQSKPLTVPQEQWPAIKAKTIEDYYQGFKDAIVSLKAKHK